MWLQPTETRPTKREKERKHAHERMLNRLQSIENEEIREKYTRAILRAYDSINDSYKHDFYVEICDSIFTLTKNTDFGKNPNLDVCLKKFHNNVAEGTMNLLAADDMHNHLQKYLNEKFES